MRIDEGRAALATNPVEKLSAIGEDVQRRLAVLHVGRRTSINWHNHMEDGLCRSRRAEEAFELAVQDADEEAEVLGSLGQPDDLLSQRVQRQGDLNVLQVEVAKGLDGIAREWRLNHIWATDSHDRTVHKIGPILDRRDDGVVVELVDGGDATGLVSEQALQVVH